MWGSNICQQNIYPYGVQAGGYDSQTQLFGL